MSILLLFLLGCTAELGGHIESSPAVGPSRLEPEPEQEPQLRIVLDSAPVSASAACPMDASVQVQVMDGPSVFGGSGTVVDSSDGQSLILTCAHIWAGCKNPDIRVIVGKRDLVATIVRQDTYTDLAVLRVDAELPCIDLAESLPSVGDTVISIGSSHNGQQLQELTHTVSRIGLQDKPPTIQTDNRSLQWSGRSGGGLFHNGNLVGSQKLVGVVQAFGGLPNEPLRSVYATVGECRNILAKSVGVAASGPTNVELWKAPFKCIPCDRSEKAIVGDPRFSVTVKTGPAPFMTDDWKERNKLRGYPYFKFDVNGESKIYHGLTSADGLADLIESLQTPPVESSAPVGASIHGRAAIAAAFDKIEQWAGPNKARVSWTNRDGKKVLPINESFDFNEIRGTEGRLEIACDSATVPFKELAIDYAYVCGKLKIRLNGSAEFDVPEDETVGSPVGDPVTILYTVFSIAKTIWDLAHPTISIVLPETLAANTEYADRKLTIDCDGTGPALRLHWKLFWGLIRWELNRPLTGLVVTEEAVNFEFHRSRTFRDVVMEVVE